MSKKIDSMGGKSDSLVVESGDANSVVELLGLRGEESFSINDIAVQYSSSATQNNILLEVHDGTTLDSVGDLSQTDAIDLIELDAGDRVEMDGMVRDDIEEDIVVVSDRATAGQDGDIYVTIGGVVVTS